MKFGMLTNLAEDRVPGRCLLLRKLRAAIHSGFSDHTLDFPAELDQMQVSFHLPAAA
jgi:hypothetical protein